MNNFNYINKEYVNPIDLEILGNTYNTLEQGHKEAVKAASDLQVAIANLDMNEAENGWKQNKLAEIEKTIDDNTIYGNSYGALDDIILKTGNLMSDTGTIGRLQAQKDYKDFQARVDNMNIPDGMKEMYKEINPYYYEDGPIDTSTGKVTAGTKWQPNKSPVTHIDEFSIMKSALDIVATETNNSETVYFLDAAGNPTTDPSQSVDGAIYKQVGIKSVKLPKEKIKAAIQLARRTITGAEDSLRQDYDYEVWKYKKMIDKAEENGEIITPIIEGFTDKNGRILSYENWLDYKFDKFADYTKYTHVEPNIRYGTALENKRKREIEYNKTKNDITNNLGVGSNYIGRYEVEANSFSDAIKVKDGANKQATSIINSIIDIEEVGEIENVSDFIKIMKNEDGTYSYNDALNNFFNKYGQNMTNEQKTYLTESVLAYERSNAEINKMLEAAGTNKDALIFSENVDSQIYTSDNKYGKIINNTLNEVFINSEKLRFTIGEQVYDTLCSIYNVTDLKKIGLNYSKNDNKYIIEFNSNNGNLLPLFSSNIIKADNMVPGTFDSGIKRYFDIASEENYIVEAINYKLVKRGIASSIYNTYMYGEAIVNKLSKTYDEGIEEASNIEEKVGITDGFVTWHGTDASSLGELQVREDANKFGYTPAEIETITKQANARLDNLLANGRFDFGRVFLVDENGNITKNITESQKLASLVQFMYSRYPNYVNRIYAPVTNIDGPGSNSNAYKLTFTVPGTDAAKKDLGNLDDYAGKQMEIIISDSNIEGTKYNPNLNSTNIASNIITTAKATNSNVTNLGYNNYLGDTRLKQEDGYTFRSNFMGTDVVLNELQARDFTAAIFELENLKINIINGNLYNPQLTQEDNIENVNNQVITVANKLALLTNQSPEIVLNRIYSFIGDNN